MKRRQGLNEAPRCLSHFLPHTPGPHFPYGFRRSHIFRRMHQEPVQMPVPAFRYETLVPAHILFAAGCAPLKCICFDGLIRSVMADEYAKVHRSFKARNSIFVRTQPCAGYGFPAGCDCGVARPVVLARNLRYFLKQLYES